MSVKITDVMLVEIKNKYKLYRSWLGCTCKGLESSWQLITVVDFAICILGE
jgi:hypothetical protein